MLCSVHCTVQSVQCTVQYVQCTVQSVQCAVCAMHSTLANSAVNSAYTKHRRNCAKEIVQHCMRSGICHSFCTTMQSALQSFCIVQCTVCTALYSTALLCTEHCSVLYNAVCTTLCSVCALHCSALSMRINAVQCSVQCSVVQCSVLCSAVHCSVSARLPDHTHITRIHTLTFKETGCHPVPAPMDPPTPPEAFCTLARRRTRTHTHSLTT